MDRRRHGFESQLGAVTAKLESLSPLAVLARGYAVCWNADRTAVIGDAATVAVGDRVTVTLQRGELSCEVADRRVPSDDRTSER
jgi:exodeoxyribonuclease VII large subunit